MDLLETSKRLAALAEQDAATRGIAITVSVVDCHGNVVLKQRMTGAPLISLEMSERKAYTAAVLGMSTAQMTPLVQPGEPLYSLTSASGGRYVALGGGLPLVDGGAVVAGFGVSGGTTEQDVAIADAARARLGEPSG